MHFFLLLTLFLSTVFAQDASLKGPEKIDGSFYYAHPYSQSKNGFLQNLDSFRLQLGINSLNLETQFTTLSFLDTDITGSLLVSSGEVELSRLRAIFLRFKFAKIVTPIDFGSFFRDTDRGIDYGVDILSMRFPIVLGNNGAITVKPGLDLGVRHYQKPIDNYYFTGSATLDMQAKVDLIENWLGAGLLSQFRYDLDKSLLSGFSANQTVYLSFVLVGDKLYGRAFVQLQEQPKKDDVGLPPLTLYSGLGALGYF